MHRPLAVPETCEVKRNRALVRDKCRAIAPDGYAASNCAGSAYALAASGLDRPEGNIEGHGFRAALGGSYGLAWHGARARVQRMTHVRCIIGCSLFSTHPLCPPR